MSKREKHLHKARKLYIEMRYNINEIADKIDVCNQTISNWKRYDREKNNIDWDQRRQEFLDRKRGLVDETTEFLQDYIKKCQEDIDQGNDLSVGRLYTLKDFVPFLMKLQDKDDAEAVKSINPDDLDFSGSLNEMIQSQASMVVQQLYNEDLDSATRTKLLEKLAKIQKDMQKTELQNHLKSLDAKIVTKLVRRFKPDADDDEVIKIYKEAVAEAKNDPESIKAPINNS